MLSIRTLEMREKEMDKNTEDFDFHRFRDPYYGEESAEESDSTEPFPTRKIEY